ncbi:hypothetical protein [Methylobacterium sp. Leaf88]|uniref:hypothetical protein n=1 Tax=Methylobacterium sp. Leaf88 TaxID=1736244 RepID=UPI000A43FAFB|nr:hypothetical protein [Methylobacterium sp. Leaf88]
MIELDGTDFFHWGSDLTSFRALDRKADPSVIASRMLKIRDLTEAILLSPLDLDVAMAAGRKFIDTISGTYQIFENAAQGGPEVDSSVYIQIETAASRFITVLLAELARSNTYIVPARKGYSPRKLINEGLTIFPVGIEDKVPEAAEDLKEATKCMAFGLLTAAAFHLHRSNEAILRKYYRELRGEAPQPNGPSMGAYIAAMEKHNIGTPEVTSCLRDITRMYRNPVAHPEHFVESIDELNAIFGLVGSAMFRMLKELP